MSARTSKEAGAVTLTDVARRAGVNKVTVSVVLNNSRANTRVSEATRQRIFTAAAELKYQPNAVARSLRRRRTNIIGLYNGYGDTDAMIPFLAQIIAGLQHACGDYRKDLLIHGILSRSSADEVYGEVVNGKVDGLVLIGPPDHPLAAQLADSHLPVVAVADPAPGMPSVSVDDALGGRLQAEHLAARGHRHALFMMPLQDRTSARRRCAAFRETAAKLGMKVLEVTAADVHGSMGSDAEALLTATGEGRPTAVACWEDLCGYRVLAGCVRLGLTVPDGVAEVGFDGVEPFTEPVWRLSTIRAPWKEVAYRALALLVDAIEGRPVPPASTLPVELVIGNSS
jgi:DNA-binding LacI/PurR family transcriptional regulator